MTLQETNKLLFQRIEELSYEIQGLEKRRNTIKGILERSLDWLEVSWILKPKEVPRTELRPARRTFRKAKRRENKKPLQTAP